jgi:hypothetical protein
LSRILASGRIDCGPWDEMPQTGQDRNQFRILSLRNLTLADKKMQISIVRVERQNKKSNNHFHLDSARD